MEELEGELYDYLDTHPHCIITYVFFVGGGSERGAYLGSTRGDDG